MTCSNRYFQAPSLAVTISAGSKFTHYPQRQKEAWVDDLYKRQRNISACFTFLEVNTAITDVLQSNSKCQPSS